ncbi:MAG: Spy/CpxP family protein refolding chaperone [Myxococcales bacterium]|nr:Spy/CpxP family protein refolding chaperone [Myxococcales bacterium]
MTEAKSKNWRRRGFVWGAIGLSALGFGAVAAQSAQAFHRGRGGPGHGIQFVLKRALKHVDATEAQRAKIDELVKQHMEVLKDQKGERKAMRQKMLSILSQEKVNPAAAEELRKEFVEQADAKSVVMKDLMLEVAKVLTPEQRKKIATLASKRGERGAKGDRRGRRHRKEGRTE